MRSPSSLFYISNRWILCYLRHYFCLTILELAQLDKYAYIAENELAFLSNLFSQKELGYASNDLSIR